MKAKFNIGNKVWYAERITSEERELCPDCFGKKYLTVVLGDDSKITIECESCKRGYDSPTGYVLYRIQKPAVKEVIINRVEMSEEEGIRYGYDGCYINMETHFFQTKEEAEKRAIELMEQFNQQERDNFHKKERDTKSWAWHVYYFRRQIKDAEKQIERSKIKLDWANSKAKE